MAVEARVSPFPTQVTGNRNFIETMNAGSTDFYANRPEGLVPLSAARPPEPILPSHQQPRIFPEILPAELLVKTESGLGINYNAADAAVYVPRNHHKRSRGVFGDNHLNSNIFPANLNHPPKMSKVSPFLAPEAEFEIERNQLEIDRLISYHTQRLRMELEDKVKQQSRALLSSVHDSVLLKLKEKDEEIRRLGNMNWLLQERVKSLTTENQIWRGLAQTNEATANSLRSNLEHALARPGGDDDAESCCGSNDPGAAVGDAAAGSRMGPRRCRACGERESVVLLLPCRHLCLCAACGPSHHNCPACGSAVTASVHVNLSSSS